ncbi:pyridoxal 5'-phosphate synthase glutaminase subunit PdxT [Candidatus Woesearchaeota archaeon]|nr:pyridoxal 5'-phosphate synthase glutaminase subunit PdxT [Candidatus Woesearchaeota archaeon]
MKIGVLSLQGSFREHIEMLKKCKVDAAAVKLPNDLNDLDGLIIPGGESTAIGNLMQLSHLDMEIIKRNGQGMAIYGTCAGAIILSKSILGSSQPRLGLFDISIKRNNYGRQADSFETELEIEKIGKFNGIFIRAPVIEKVNNGVQVLSKLENKPILVQKGNLLASTFHPELTNDKRVHEYFVEIVKNNL